MSQQALDLKRSVQILRRRKILVGTVVALGLLIGAAYPVLRPPMFTSTALVVLPQSAQSSQPTNNTGEPDSYTATQEVIAGSNQVLSRALPHVQPAVSLDGLRSQIEIGSVTSLIISITAQGKVAADVQATANAVAHSYVSYISSRGSPVGHISAQLLQPATHATRPSLAHQLLIYALCGALGGALVGIIAVLAISRNDRRLRERDEIANSIGVPVLASFPVSHPDDAADWAKLMEDYHPGVVNAWQVRQALRLLGMGADNPDNGSLDNGHYHPDDVFSVTVLSVSADRGALALGPQLAAFAASQDIPTTLVIGPQQDADVTATLRAAYAVPPHPSSNQSGYLQVIVSDGDIDRQPETALSIVVAVVDSRTPRVPPTMRTTATVLGVSAGAATADQLARAAMSAADDGREISGILVADPEPTDRTTGRIPQLPRRHRRQPTRLKG